MKGKSFKAKISEAKVIFEMPSEWEIAKQNLEGEDVIIRIDKWYKSRTNAQIKYYYGVIVTILAEFSGHDKDEIHSLLKQKFIPKTNVMGEDISGTTTTMSTVEFEDFAREIRMWASRDLSVYIPEPNEAPGFAYNIEDLKDKEIKI